MNIDRHESSEWSGISFFCLIIGAVLTILAYFVMSGNIDDKKKTLDNTAYCITVQVEQHRTPNACPYGFMQPTAKLLLSLVQNHPIETRQRLAQKAIGANTNEWSHGIYRAIYDELPSEQRIELYLKYARREIGADLNNTITPEQLINVYQTSNAKTQQARLQTIQKYDQTLRDIDKELKAFRHRFTHVWMPIEYIGLNLLVLIIFLVKRRPVSAEGDFIFMSIVFPIILANEIILGILSLIFLPHRTWLKGTFERRRLRNELGDDVLTFLDQIKDLKKKLREWRIPEQKRSDLEQELRRVEGEIEQLREERKRTLADQEKERTDTPEHQIGEEIEVLGLRVSSTRENDRSLRRQTSSGLSREFEELAITEDPTNAQTR